MKIVEMFVSLQGEGLHQGMPAMFIRFAGCNLSCLWCDTNYSHDENIGCEMTVEGVCNAVTDSGVSYVCITGGEPLLQKDELLKLLASLHEKNIMIDIETNGTQPFAEVQRFANIEMDVKCPSSGEKSDLSLIKLLRANDALKFVVGDEADYLYMKKILEENLWCKASVYVTPVYGADVKRLSDAIVRDLLPVRFQLQIHKELDIA